MRPRAPFSSAASPIATRKAVIIADWIPLTAGWLLFALWGLLLGPVWVVVGRWRLANLAAQVPVPPDWPLISIIVPARDEQAMIETALQSLLALDYPHLEIIAVNDRSRDATGALMDRLAATDNRLRVVHITELPAGWLGKSHAMHQGATAAQGEWLLFTDGDIVYTPHTMRLAMQWVLARQLDHLCMNPSLVGGGYWERAMTVCFGLMFFASFLVWLIPTPWKGAYCGVGAFNLVRAAVYRQVGGFERLKLDVLDDVYLGKLIKRCGYRQQLVMGDDLIRVRWQPSFMGVIRGLEKNSFAAVQYSLLKLLVSSAVLIGVSLVPYAGLLLLPAASAWGFVGALLVMHGTYAYMAWRSASTLWVTPMLPVMFMLFLYTLWRSACITLRNGGVRWRDTFYPLDELRRHQFR
ncbi:MAG: glycosyltransferase [Planctomycetes bacterium]|nr:glycosyltransferase [Planctomycetota bacterium]